MSDSILGRRSGAETRRIPAFLTSPLTILVAACAVRGAYLWWRAYGSGSVAADVLNADGNEAWNIARSIVAGTGYSSPFGAETGPTAWVTPVYPALLAALFKLFGSASQPSFIAAAGLNLFFSALTVLPIYYIGKRIGGRPLGAIAAWLWTIHPLSVSIAYQWIWYTSLSTLLTAGILWGTLAIADSERARDWIGYGLLWGFSLLTNAAAMSLAPFVFAWLIYRRHAGRKDAGRKHAASGAKFPGLAVACMVLLCIPWMVRNYVIFQGFMPLRSNLGCEVRMLQLEGPSDNAAEEALFYRLGEAAYCREKGREALQIMAQNPGAALYRGWGQFLKTWTGHEHPVWNFAQKTTWTPRVGMILYSGLSALALWGMVFFFRTGDDSRWLVAVHVLIFPLVYYVAHTGFNYRLPIDPVVVLLAAVPLAQLGRVGLQRPAAAASTASGCVPEIAWRRR